MSAPTVPTPRVTATMVKLLDAMRAGYVVQTDDGTVFACERLTTAQLDDPAVVVLLDYTQVSAYLTRFGTPGEVARAATAELAALIERGLL